MDTRKTAEPFGGQLRAHYLGQLERGRVGREGELGADDGGLVAAAAAAAAADGLGGRGVEGGARRRRVGLTAVVVEEEVVLRLQVQQVDGAPLAPAGGRQDAP